jgi:hypothetical protein
VKRPGEHWALLALALLLCGVYLYFAAARRPEDPIADHSTYRTNAAGCKALYTWLAQRGYEVHRVERPLVNLPLDEGLLCVLAPTQTVEADEAERLLQWVEEGGTLLLSCDRPMLAAALTGRPAIEALEEAFGLRSAWYHGESRRLRPTGDAPYWRDVEYIELPNTVRITGGGRPLLGRPGQAAVVELSVGAGKVVALSEAAPLSNQGLGRADNAIFTANLFYALSDGRPIYFDEYHHGFSGSPTFGRLMARTGLSRAVWPVVVGLLVLAIARGRRFGVPRPAFRRERREAVEFVYGFGNLYREARASQGALRLLYEGFRRRVAHTVGAGATAGNAELARLAAGTTGVNAEELRSLLDTAEGLIQDGRVTEQTLLDMAQRMAAYRREFYRDAERHPALG